MKIVFLNDGIYGYACSDASAVGGSERQQWLLARALASSGWSVQVGVRHGLQSEEHQTIERVDFQGIMQRQCLLDWYRFLKTARPDWLYWRAATHLLGPLIEIARSLRIRTIFAAAFDTDVRPRSALTWRKKWWPLYAWGLLRADRIFVQHGGQLEGLPSRWQSKAWMIRSIAAMRASCLPHVSREPYVAWVGMLRQPKRPDLLVEVAKRSPELKYLVCGGPSNHRSSPGYSQRIVEQFRGCQNIHFCGQVPPGQAEKVISRAAALLCTSDDEGFPNTFLQAWSYGTPVVTLKVDPDSVIKRFDLGAVTGTVDATAEQLQRLLKSPDEREGIAVRAGEYLAAHHRDDVVVQAVHRAVGPAVSA